MLVASTRLDDEGNHSGIIAARWELSWKRRRERDGRIDNRGRRTNPFNRESIYITDLPNNNSVSSAGWSTESFRATSQSAQVAPSRRCLLPISEPVFDANASDSEFSSLPLYRSDLRDFAGECKENTCHSASHKILVSV